jgi:NAD(P)-dependent dehydrogenase (short-subunit alcohol dehydrogenase family)
MDTANKAMAAVKAKLPTADLIPMACDLGSLKSIQAFAAQYKASGLTLHVLINNAGVLHKPRHTADGLEGMMGINHVGTMLLTMLLLDCLKASAPSRVVTVSSRASVFYNEPAGIRLDDLNAEKEYDPWRLYGQSKLANILFAKELQRRLTAAGVTGVTSVSLHPGDVVSTRLGRGVGIFSAIGMLFKYPGAMSKWVTRLSRICRCRNA